MNELTDDRMTEAEVRQWIEACNHEPARQVLRDYLALRAVASTSTEGAGVKGLTPEDVEWVVNDIAELGVKIGNQFFFLYKGYSLVYGWLNPDPTKPPTHDDGTPMHWRPVFKREFGECAHPINYKNLNLIGTVSLDDSDEWKPIPAALNPPASKVTTDEAEERE